VRAVVAGLIVSLAASCSSRDTPRPPIDTGGAAAVAAAKPAIAAEPVPAAEAPIAESHPATPGAAAQPPDSFRIDAPTDGDEANDKRPEPKGKPVELLLRSSPPGAIASVAGEPNGSTPVLWRGTAEGQALDVTFVLPGYATARYRFVPVQNGEVHGTLERIKLVEADAGP
jgi:hypothetical protein